MSSSIGSIYSVPWDELRQLRGSRRKQLAQLIAKEYIHREEIDDLFADSWDDQPRTLKAASLQILSGERLRRNRGSLYGYAVEALCWSVGSTITLPINFPNHELVDRYLSRRRAPVKLAQLLFSGFPIKIPIPEDFPMAGMWNREHLLLMAAFLKRVGAVPGEMGGALDEIRRWIAEATRFENDVLVGFYY